MNRRIGATEVTEAMVDAELAKQARRDARRGTIPIVVFQVVAALCVIVGVLGLALGGSTSDGPLIAVAGIGGGLAAFAVASILDALRGVRNAIEDR